LADGYFNASNMRFVGFLAIVGRPKFAENSYFSGFFVAAKREKPWSGWKFRIAARIYAGVLPWSTTGNQTWCQGTGLQIRAVQYLFCLQPAL